MYPNLLKGNETEKSFDFFSEHKPEIKTNSLLPNNVNNLILITTVEVVKLETCNPHKLWREYYVYVHIYIH